jgi:PAS domain S-box-containing protein
MKATVEEMPERSTARRVLSYVALAILVSLSALAWRFYENVVTVRERRRFDAYVEQLNEGIIHHLDRYKMILHGGAGILAASVEVTREEWRNYYAYHEVRTLVPGIQAIGFAQAVPHSELMQHIQAVRSEGLPDYTVWPAGQRDMYTPVVFVEPWDAQNQRVLGYDELSEPVRRVAITRAWKTGTTAISGRVNLVQQADAGSPLGFLMFVPVYANGMPLETVEQREAAIRGCVYGSFFLRDLMDGIVPDPLHSIDFKLFDGAEVSPQVLLFDSDGAAGAEYRPMFRTRETLDLYGHQWTLAVETAPEFEAVVDRYTAKIVLAAGLIISLLIFLLITTLERTGIRAYSLARKMTSALRESEQRYRVLNDTLSVGASIIGPNMEILASNETKRRWFPDDRGRQCPPCYAVYNNPPKTEPCEGCPVVQTFQDGQPHVAEREAVTVLGPRILSIRTMPLTSPDGRITSVHETVEDITERKRAESALKESEREKSLILDNAKECIAYHDRDQRLVWANRAYLAGVRTATGLPVTVEDVRGTTCFESWGLGQVCNHCPVSKAIQSGQADEAELTPENQPHWPAAQGSWFVRATPVRDSSGAVIGAIELAHDITERKRTEAALRASEKRYAELAAHARTVTWEVDVDGVYRFVSPAVEAVLGYCPEELIGKKHFFDLAPAEDRDAVREFGLKILREHGTCTNFENRMLAKDGRLVWVLSNGVSMFGRQGQLIGFSGSDTDITERKQAERDRIAWQVAEAANRQKSRFLSNMSHEIRTPLNAILGFAQILEHDPSLTPKQMAQLRSINRSGVHLLDLINDILDMSKIEAGMTEVNRAVFGLHDLLDDLQMMFQSRAKAKGLRLIVERDENVPYHVLGDASKLRQVLINLIGNAVKFTQRGGVVVRVRAQPAAGRPAEDGQILRLVVEVEDSGPGIPAADLHRIFAAFVQGEAGAVAGGTGLGLTISAKLVELMGGRLTVESEVGKGSCFRFDALLERTEDVPQREEPAARRVIGLEPGTGPWRILVVDDAPDNRALLADLLRPLGFEIRDAHNGAVALEVFRQWAPHAVLMDMRMPVMDGYEATRQIKASEAGRTVPVIAVTASAFKNSQAAVLATGVSAYLRKPFRPDELYEALASCLDLRYVYADEAHSSGGRRQPAAVSPKALVALPAALVQSLRQAVADGDVAGLTELIGQVEAFDSAAARGLQALADRYDYAKLDELLGNGGNDNG